MLQTLFVIPYEVGGVRLFGLGWLLAAWGVFCAVIFYRTIRREGFSAEVKAFLPVAAIVAAAILLLPRLFPTGLPVRGYGVFMLSGIVSGVALAWFRARRTTLNPDLILTLAFWLVFAGIFGARAFYVIEYWERDYLRDNWRDTMAAVLNVSQGGLVVYGGFIGAMAAVVLFVRKYRVPGLALADLIAPSMFLGLALGRIGCFLNGCCYGGACELPWAVEFPWDSPPHQAQAKLPKEKGGVDLHGLWFEGAETERAVISTVEPDSAAAKAGLQAGDQLIEIQGVVRDYDENGILGPQPVQQATPTIGAARAGLLKVHGDGATITIEAVRRTQAGTPLQIRANWALAPAPRSHPVHPTQLYASITATLICLLLLVYAPLHRRDGEVIGLALLVYPIARFFEERIRIDEAGVFGTGLSISENVSILVFASAVVLWIHIWNRPPRLALAKSA